METSRLAPISGNVYRESQREERLKRIENNKRSLDEIFNEIVSVCNQLRFTKDRNSRKVLLERYRILSNKYAFSNGIDDTIESNF